MNELIDNYCERLGPGFWAEPLNALTNLSFLVAALAVWKLARQLRGVSKDSALLILLLVCSGIGSFLFHTLATRWAQLADVLPILFYQIAFIGLYCRRVMGWSPAATALVLAAFVAVSHAAGMAPAAILNGSLSYAPALIALLALAIRHWLVAAREQGGLLIATALFTASLALRSLDMAACALIPAGLHFFWHVLNGMVLYLTARAVMLNGRPS